MSIVFGAQACGFGPVSKMASLALGFKDTEKVFIGNDISLQFVNKQKSLFSKVIDRNNVNPQAVNKSIKNASYGVIVMDHELAFRFYLAKKRYYFIDSLFGFWYSRKNENTLSHLFFQFSTMSKEDTIKNYHLLKVHEQKLFAHFNSEMSFIQNFFDVEKRVMRLRKLGFKNLIITNPIIDNYQVYSYKNLNNGEMLINLGGIENFLVDSNNAAYLKLVEKLVIDLIKLPSIKKIHVCAGSFKVPKSQVINDKRIVFSFEDKVSFHNLLKNAQFYLSSPGMTAFYEGLYYKKPTVYLPEQHASQYYNMNHIKKTWLKPFCLTLFNVIGEKKISPNDFRGSSQIVKYVKQILHDKNLYEKLKQKLYKKIETIRIVDLKNYQQRCEETIKLLTVPVSYTNIENIIRENEQAYM